MPPGHHRRNAGLVVDFGEPLILHLDIALRFGRGKVIGQMGTLLSLVALSIAAIVVLPAISNTTRAVTMAS